MGNVKELLSKRRKVSADGAACEFAGVDRYTFLGFCKREGIPLQTQTPEELAADLKKFAS